CLLELEPGRLALLRREDIQPLDVLFHILKDRPGRTNQDRVQTGERHHHSLLRCLWLAGGRCWCSTRPGYARGGYPLVEPRERVGNAGSVRLLDRHDFNLNRTGAQEELDEGPHGRHLGRVGADDDNAAEWAGLNSHPSGRLGAGCWRLLGFGLLLLFLAISLA